MSPGSYDNEKAPSEVEGASLEDGGAVAVQSYRSTGVLGKMWAAVKTIDKYVGIEVRGIERVLPEEKVPPTRRDWWDNLWLWLAANCTISSLALGTLGPATFGLSGKVSILTVIFFNLLSTLPVAYFSIFGAKLGLRQMTITRFSCGYWVSLFPVVLNVIACVGWSTINTIVGAQTLRAVSGVAPDPHIHNQIPQALAIIIIALLSLLAPFFGYKVVHAYERYAWIPIAIIFFVVLGLSAKDMDLGSVTAPNGESSAVLGGVLSFGAAIFGFGIGWCSYAADYTVHMSESSSSFKIFLFNYIGLNIPLILVESLGAGLATAISTREDWQDAFDSGGVGGLLGIALQPAGGFGKFCLVVMALSIVANNIPNMYSFALTFQVLGKHAQAIPRVFLVISGTIAYIILAIIGADHFESWLDTLLVILSYWLSIYSTILIEEHLIFRKGKWSNYNVEDYTDHTRLPIGWAAGIAMCFGVMGAVFGMATLWYIGIVGAKIGDPAFGGDVGFELSLGFTALVYPVLRAVERCYESPRRRGLEPRAPSRDVDVKSKSKSESDAMN